MMSKKTIHVSEFLASTISSREIVSDVLAKIIRTENTKEVLLDFSNIDFISRSAAHELLKLKERFRNDENDQREITFIAMSKEVANMVRTVASNRAYVINPDEKNIVEKVNILQLI